MVSLKKKGEVAYRLDLPPEALIHKVFHVSQLKKKLGQKLQVQHCPQALTEEFELQLRPETVLGVRWNREIGGNEWLIKSKKLPDSEATRLSAYLMNQQLPSFHLRDKVHFEPACIVKLPILHTYKRRGKRGNVPGAAWREIN